MTGRREVSLTINGIAYTGDAEPRLLLADFIRQECGLTGTHLGCEHGVCGACTVLVGGEPMRSCLMFAVQAEGADITTVEGLAAPDGALHPLQESFREHHGLQCGFCTPGMLLTALALLHDNPHPSEREIREGIAGSLCRCTGYESIVRAIGAAAEKLAAA